MLLFFLGESFRPFLLLLEVYHFDELASKIWMINSYKIQNISEKEHLSMQITFKKYIFYSLKKSNNQITKSRPLSLKMCLFVYLFVYLISP